jgi:hypothetical protein
VALALPVCLPSCHSSWLLVSLLLTSRSLVASPRRGTLVCCHLSPSSGSPADVMVPALDIKQHRRAATPLPYSSCVTRLRVCTEHIWNGGGCRFVQVWAKRGGQVRDFGREVRTTLPTHRSTRMASGFVRGWDGEFFMWGLLSSGGRLLRWNTMCCIWNSGKVQRGCVGKANVFTFCLF